MYISPNAVLLWPALQIFAGNWMQHITMIIIAWIEHMLFHIYILRLLHLHESYHQTYDDSNHQNKCTIVFCLPIIATFHDQCQITVVLWHCHVLLCMYVENRWFEEKWILIHLHFAQDGHKWKSKKRKNFFEM